LNNTNGTDANALIGVQEQILPRLGAGLFSHAHVGELALNGGLAMRAQGFAPTRRLRNLELLVNETCEPARLDRLVRRGVKGALRDGDLVNTEVSGPVHARTGAARMRWEMKGKRPDGAEVSLYIGACRGPIDASTVEIRQLRASPSDRESAWAEVCLPEYIALTRLDRILEGPAGAATALYDLAALVRSGVSVPAHVLRKSVGSGLQALPDVIRQGVERISWARFRDEIMALEPRLSPGAELTSDTFGMLKSLVCDTVGEWASLAIEDDEDDDLPSPG